MFELDCRGLKSPLAMLLLKKSISRRDVPNGSIKVLLSVDIEENRKDIKRFCEQTDYRLVAKDADEGIILRDGLF